MDELEIITTALSAGAGAGISGVASESIQAGLAELKGMLRRRFAGRRTAQRSLDFEGGDPAQWAALIGQDIMASGANRDAEILAAAHRLMDLVGARRSGRVYVSHAQGVQFGNFNVQNNNFN